MEEALQYAEQLVGTPYGWWTGGGIPTGSPMWAMDGSVPEAVDACNCAGLTNLMLRHANRSLPFHPDTGRGGTGAYGAVYAAIGQPFVLGQSYPRGTLLLRRYRDVADQGD